MPERGFHSSQQLAMQQHLGGASSKPGAYLMTQQSKALNLGAAGTGNGKQPSGKSAGGGAAIPQN